MSLLKKFSFGVCAMLLVSTLLGLGLAWGAYQTLNNAGPLKAAIRESGLYETGLGEALKQSQKENVGQAQEGIPIDRPEVQEIVKQAFPPQYLQTQTEKVIDSTYSWLHGDTPTLSFTINTGEAKTRLADGMGKYVENRLNSLPVCTAADLQTATANGGNGNVDPFNAPCVPPGYNKAEAVTKARDEILKGDFLKDATVSADNIKNDQGEPLSQQLQAAPQVYNTLAVALYTSMGIAAILGAGVVFLSATWRQGLRRLGIMLLSIGAVSGLLAWLTDAGIQKASKEFMKTTQDNQVLQEKVFSVVALLIGDMRGHWMWYAAVVVVLGAGALAGWYFTRPSAAETAHALADDMPPLEQDEKKEVAEPTEPKVSKPNLPEMKMNYAKTPVPPVKKKPGES